MQVEVRALYGSPPVGASPSGKAPDFDSGIRRFDPSRPSQSVPCEPLLLPASRMRPSYRGLRTIYSLQPRTETQTGADLGRFIGASLCMPKSRSWRAVDACEQRRALTDAADVEQCCDVIASICDSNSLASRANDSTSPAAMHCRYFSPSEVGYVRSTIERSAQDDKYNPRVLCCRLYGERAVVS